MNTEEMKKALKEWADGYKFNLTSSSCTVDPKYGDYIVTTDKTTTVPYYSPTYPSLETQMQSPMQEMQNRIDRLEKKVKWLEMALAVMLDGKEVKEGTENEKSNISI